ncbi:Epidermal growth factor receptor isoform X5 [Oopsacas minuta]|uniref:receptor protein-tyrosine kinase n=1 Tax=Oopsacas minuta TaxID=111878 RepID=A0AAV7JCY8_9METZ|nr:Epidermal growth factor receptor isoform X5 [Oopsacas minuta]
MLIFVKILLFSGLITFTLGQCPVRELCISKLLVNIQPLSYFDDEYCGCRRILGTLSIFLDSSSPELQNSNFSFLNQLEEVTGHILFSNVKTPELILPRLRIIEGRDPFIPSFGTQKYAIFFTNCTIDQILFPQLTYIAAHTVGILENRDVTGAVDITKEILDPNTGCNLYGINWIELLRTDEIIFRIDVEVSMNYDNTVILDLASECNVTLTESLCEQCLEDACWNMSNCQILTSSYSLGSCTLCNPLSGCYDVDQGLCCHEFCLGGCYGPGADQCYGCRDKYNDEICVETCPPQFVLNPTTLMAELNPDGKFTLDKFCVPECIGNYIQFDEECVLRCPAEYTQVVDGGVLKCQKCGSACPVECNGTDINGVSNALEVDTVHLFENCTRVNGPIVINSATYEGINETGLRYLESITEITGYLAILHSPASINVFDFLRNLQIIEGNTFYLSGTSSVVIGFNNFEYIDLSALQTVNAGIISVLFNSNLCYLANLTVFRPEGEISLSNPADYPDDPNCTCDYECEPEHRCWGPGPTRCVSCRNFLHERTCVRNCSGIPHVFSNIETKTCSPCNIQCLNSCTDATSFTCDACVYVKYNNECVESCPDNNFIDEAKTCITCNSLCVMGCTGPNITISDGGCNLCGRIVMDEEDNQIGCIAGDICPGISFYERTESVSEVVPDTSISDTDIKVCRPCDSLCESCSGPGVENCLTCKYFINNDVCVETCEANMYVAIKECKSCNQECIGCTGPTSFDCTECRNFNDEGECVEACGDGKYEDSSANCALCHGSCGTCDGSGKYNCTACNDPNFFTMWGVSNATCTGECYEGFYGEHSTISECLACDPLCKACTSIDDCTECLFAKLDGKCLIECPPNYGLDENAITCTPNNASSLGETLDEYKFPIIGAFLAGITIVVCGVISFFICIVFYFRASKKKLKVEEELENPTYALLPKDLRPSVGSVEMDTLGSNLTKYSRLRMGSQDSLVEADMTQLVIADLTRIEKKEVLGKGAFGIVYRGVWLPVDGEPVMVAIKELNQDAPIEDMQELIKEAVLLAKMRNKYLVRFYCLCMARQLMVINELVQGGSLLDYLKIEGKYLTPSIRLTFMQQIASGMNYLESRRLVHRDLASRNCLVASNELVKISDFGMSRILDVGEDQYISSGGKIPVRWMPLESIFYKQYSHKSDIWSYGITVWEILTSAKRPYGNVKPQQVIELLVSGDRLEQPKNCSSKLYHLLNQCWIDKPDDRISFESLSHQLQEMLNEPSLYVYGDPDHGMRSESRDSSIVPDYEEIDDEVMAYLVTTQVQILVRDAINGKRGGLNYENLRVSKQLTGDQFSNRDNTAGASFIPPPAQSDDINEYSLANDSTTQKVEVYQNISSNLNTDSTAVEIPESDYMLANDVVSKTGANNSSNFLSPNHYIEGESSVSNRTSKTDSGSEYMQSNDIYVTDTKNSSDYLETRSSKNYKKMDVYINPYSDVKLKSNLDKTAIQEKATDYVTPTLERTAQAGYYETNPDLERTATAGYLENNPDVKRTAPTEYLDSTNPTLERIATAGYLETNPEVERTAPSEYLDSNPTLERTAQADYLETNAEVERTVASEYLDSNPTLERTAPTGYLGTNPDVKRTAPSEYLDSNPTLERTAQADYLETNAEVERTVASEYLDSNPTLERTAPTGYLGTNPDVKRTAPSEYLDSNPTLERTAQADYLETNLEVERTVASEYLDSNPTLERTAPTGYLGTNPDVKRTAPSEYLDFNPTLERTAQADYLETNPEVERTVPTEYLGNIGTLYESLDPKTMAYQEKSNETIEYVNQERINSKKASALKKESQSRFPNTVVLDDATYMEIDGNATIVPPTISPPAVNNNLGQEPVHEYEDIDDDIPNHEYSKADDVITPKFLENARLKQPHTNNGNLSSEYSYVDQDTLTSEVAQQLTQSRGLKSKEPHYVTTILKSIPDPDNFPFEEKNPLYSSFNDSSK